MTKAKITGALELTIPDPLEALIWQLLDLPIATIEAADDGLLVRAKKWMRMLEPAGSNVELIRLSHESSAFDQTGVTAEIAEAFQIEHVLDRGGRVLIEETAACIAIDVDGGDRTALDVNIDAAQEIARLLRLRNLGGTIIVDFIDMPTKPQRQRLDEALRRAFKNDPIPVQIFAMSPLGIVQLSRARQGTQPLHTRLTTCPTCSGNGRIAR